MLPEPLSDRCRCFTFVSYPCELVPLFPPDHLAAGVVVIRPFDPCGPLPPRDPSPEVVREETVFESEFVEALPGEAALPQPTRFPNHAGGEPCREPLPDAPPHLLPPPPFARPAGGVGVRAGEARD